MGTKDIIDKIGSMELAELEAFNEAAVERIKYLRTQKNISDSTAFKVGDVVEFNSKKQKYGTVRLTIESISKGKLNGRSGFSRWSVSAGICRIV